MGRYNKIGLASRDLSHQIRRKIDNEITLQIADEVTGLQGRIIGFIRRKSEKGEVFQRDVEEELSIRRSTATGILQSMEKNGLITRVAVDYDKRLKSLILTEKALKINGKIREIIDAVEKEISDGVPKEELDIFFSVVDKVIKNFDENY